MTDQQIDEFLGMLAKSPTSARDMVRGLFAKAVPSRADQLVRKYIECLITNDPDGASDATKSMVDYVFNCPPATAHEAKAAPAVPQGLPAFDELGDEVIDAACTVGSLYRVDLMLAYERIRAMLAATPAAQSQPVTLTDNELCDLAADHACACAAVSNPSQAWFTFELDELRDLIAALREKEGK